MIHDQPDNPEAPAQLPNSAAPESHVDTASTTSTTNTPDAPRTKMGRPSLYSPELAEQICTLMIEGKLMTEIEALPGMPSATTIRVWAATRDDFRSMYARAREASGDALAERALSVAMAAKNKDQAAAARVQADNLRWLASKRAPKNYGDKTMVEMDANITNGPGKVADDAPDWLKERMEGRQAAVVAATAGAAAPATKH